MRALRRYRTRFEVTWRPAPAATATLGAALLGALVLLAAPPDDARADAPKAAIRYLERAQNARRRLRPGPGRRVDADAHGLGGASGSPRPGATRATSSTTRSPTSAATQARSAATSASARGRSSQCAPPGRGRSRPAAANLLAEIERAQQPDGSWQGLVNTTAFAVLALRAAGRPADGRAVRAGVAFIAGQANADGGFNFAGSGRPSGADDTGAALQALGAAGKRRSGAARRAAAWLESRQNADGGFSLQGGPSNAQSTAWAVQGLIAAGRDPKRVRRAGSRSPVAYLRSLVGPDGAIRYSRTSTQTPVWVTAQAVAALEGKALPLKPVRRERRPKAVPTPAPTATPAPAPRPAPTAAPEAPPAPPPVADDLGVAEPELQNEKGERVSLDEIVPQIPSPLEIGFARVVAMPLGPSAGEMGALAAVLVRFWRPPAAGV